MMMTNKAIIALKGALPNFGFSPSSTEVTKEVPFLDDYLSLYSFDELVGHYDEFRIGSIFSADYKVACMQWTNKHAVADVLVVHGLFDHCGLYTPLIKHLLKLGVNVTAFDLPEHGISSGAFGEVSSFSDYALALADVVETLDLGSTKPVCALGQSTGAAVIMNYILNCQQANKDVSLSKLIFLAPLLRVRGWKRINVTYALLHKFIKSVPRDFTKNSNDEAFFDFLKNTDPLQPKVISVPWVKAMIDWSKAFANLETCDIPGVIIQGDCDKTVNAEYNIRHIVKKFPSLKVTEIEGAFHHLVRERKDLQQQVFAEIARVTSF